MEIKNVIVSCDDSPYKDFYDINFKVWNHFGIKLNCVFIDSNSDDYTKLEYNKIKRNKVSTVPIVLQSQIARVYYSQYYANESVLISDIDMIPININYFKDVAKDLKDDEILFYSGQPYGVNNYYPMCYILAKSQVLAKLFRLERFKNFDEFAMFLFDSYNGDWNTDEHYVYDCVQLYDKNKIVVKNDRDFNRRIDRSNWNWNEELLNSGHYIDSHLLKPYNSYKNYIDVLVEKILNNESYK